MSVGYQPSVGRVSAECRPSVDRHVGRVSIDISVKSRPTCMLADIRSLGHRRSADTLPTLDRYATDTLPKFYVNAPLTKAIFRQNTSIKMHSLLICRML